MSVRTAPCLWPLDYGSCTLPESWTALTATEKATYEEMATEYLWRWTGRSLGLCEQTIRPCRDDCTEGVSTFFGGGPYSSGGLWHPVIINGKWTNIGCGQCGDDCSCGYVSTLVLPGPVDSITSITIDGSVLPVAAYRVDNHRRLVRQDGGTWPTCQNLGLPAGDPGTWSITYQRGVPVPTGGQVAAGVLAVELFKAACSDPTCGLPRRIQSITRQGVTIAMLDAFDDVDKGHTGIWLIDSWLASITQIPVRPSVYSPDMRRPRRTTSGA